MLSVAHTFNFQHLILFLFVILWWLKICLNQFSTSKHLYYGWFKLERANAWFFLKHSWRYVQSNYFCFKSNAKSTTLSTCKQCININLLILVDGLEPNMQNQSSFESINDVDFRLKFYSKKVESKISCFIVI